MRSPFGLAGAPLVTWAYGCGFTRFIPMAHFEFPINSYVSTERTPPAVDGLRLLLGEVVALIPDVAPVQVLGAVPRAANL